MIIEQLMPSLSPTMTEGILVAWRIKPGEMVHSGQVMAEIQTDKAVVEWECLDAGTVAAILVEPGATAKVNMVAAIFTTKGEDVAVAIAAARERNAALAAAPVAAAGPPPVQAAAAPVAPVAASVAPVAVAPVAVVAPVAAASPNRSPTAPVPISRGGHGHHISPVAAFLATRHGLDLARIDGTGPDGRIIRRDVENTLAHRAAQAGPTVPDATPKPKPALFRADRTPVTEVPMTMIRAAVGRRLLASKQGIPHFQVTERVDAGNLVALKAQLGAFAGTNVSYNDLVLRATALALRLHPRLNSTFDGTTIREHDSADISVAVALPDGLITPIVFKAHTLSVRQIGDTVRELAKRAAAGTLKPHEFEGGTFTVSNLGMHGVLEFNAIINPPQCAILAVAGIRDEPLVRAGSVVAGQAMRLTLSADHRVIDGVAAATFMKTLRELLEEPAELLM